MNTITSTKSPGMLFRLIVRMRLSHQRRRHEAVLRDIEYTQRTLDAWRIDAGKMRVQIALLEKIA